LPFKIDRLISDPGKLLLMRGNAMAMSKPQAAFTILETLDALRSTQPVEPAAPARKRQPRRRAIY
jgi:hypothetical protein